MNKVVRREMLAGALPAELREEFEPQQRVTVTVEPIEGPSQEDVARRLAWLDRFNERLAAARTTPGFKAVTPEEAVRRVSELRDEWER